MSRAGAGASRGPGNQLAGLLWVSPWLIGFLAFMVLPIGMSFWYSLTDYPLLEGPLYVGLDNYRQLWGDHVFWIAVRNTLVYSAAAVAAGTVFSVVVAGLLNQPVRGVTLFRAAIFVPSLVPMIASAMIWLWLFNGDLGLVNQTIGLVNALPGVEGVRGPTWLQERGWAMAAMVIISLWTVGNSVVIYLAAMRDVPRHLYEAAALDGVGPVGRFWHVTLPAISPVILFNVIWMTIVHSQVFAVPYAMTQGGPDRATYFYTMYLYDNAFIYSKMGYACAMAWVQFPILLVLTGLTFLLSRRFVHYRSA